MRNAYKLYVLLRSTLECPFSQTLNPYRKACRETWHSLR